MVLLSQGSPYRTVCDGISKWIPFRSVKGALSSGAGPAIVRPMGEELYACAVHLVVDNRRRTLYTSTRFQLARYIQFFFSGNSPHVTS